MESCVVVSGSSRTALGILGFHCGITEVVVPDLSWSYEQCFPQVHAVPLTESLELDPDAIIDKLEELRRSDPSWSERGALAINNPHNATGQVFNEEAIRKLIIYCLEHNIYIIDEHYEAGQLVSYHAGKIHEKRIGRNVLYTVIDPACKQRNGLSGKSVIDEYRDYDVFTHPGNNDVLAGINRVSEYLRVDEVTKKPRLFIFRGCSHLIEELQQYRWERMRPGAETNEPESPVKAHDHAADALRYLIMSRPIGNEGESFMPGDIKGQIKAFDDDDDDREYDPGFYSI
jgi:hypothetical protein